MGKEINWDAPGLPRLWQYNLHYFDYLAQPEMDYAAGLRLMSSWIEGHTPRAEAVGWEPFPLSLRLVNWIKFLAVEKDIPGQVLESMGLQAANLQKQIEYHLTGNHLLANGKALWFAGVFQSEPKAANLGKKIVFKEVERQFLPEGGHFELSPMYHALVLEDLLDLINLCQAAGDLEGQEVKILKKTAGKALGWLAGLVDAQGRFPLLNDAAYGVAPTFTELFEYGKRLGVIPIWGDISRLSSGGWSGVNLSGYWVLTNGPFRLLWDTAPLGPDHLLGHAHCDMLSLLLDFAGENILTDTGISQYEEGEERRYERGTSAHNTVILDDGEQAEIWKSFRVGRRGRPRNFRQENQTLRCRHNGFAIWRAGLFHERKLTLLDNGFEITDEIRGPAIHRYKAFYHFAPDVGLEVCGDHGFLVNGHLLLETWGAAVQMTTSRYCPELGRVINRPCLVLSGEFKQHHSFGVKFTSRR